LTNIALPVASNGSFDKVEHICFTERTLEDALGHLELNHIDNYPSVNTIIVAADIYGPDMRLHQLSIEEYEFAMDEQSLCAAKITDFLKKFVECYLGREVLAVLVRSIKRYH
jgi:hypothetical protein